MSFTSTGRPRVQSDKACVLFDPENGAIRYVHRVVTIEGADETPEKEIEERTRHLAVELQVDAKATESLLVDASTIDPNMQYTVDTKERRLIAKPLDSRLAGNRTPSGQAL